MVESELKSQLQEADTSKNGGYLIDVDALKEKVRKLEENLKDSDSKLFEARESVFELTALNIELTDELEFLKGTETYSEKMNSLEKQVRHLENELQKSKALTINSQEQQKELYMAIFDMETLIEDLKSKAFKAETRLEILEEQCLLLAENNSELDIQISCLQSKAENLEASLNQVHREKGSKVKDINKGAKVVADLVLQLALEREKIQKKVCSLAKENKILMEELRRSKIHGKVDSTKEHKIESVEKLPEASSTTSSPVKVNCCNK